MCVNVSLVNRFTAEGGNAEGRHHCEYNPTLFDCIRRWRTREAIRIQDSNSIRDLSALPHGDYVKC